MPMKKDIDAINRKLNKILHLLEEQKPVAAARPAVKKKAPAKKTATRKVSKKKAA